MIVKCDSCQTRFRIPDEKVTEKGVKVRCTKCAHTFRVARAEAGPAAPADPFAQFGPAPDAPMDQATRPGFYASGVAATRAPEPPRPQSSAPAHGGDLSDLFGAPPEPAPEVTATANLAVPQAARRGDPPPSRPGADLSDIFNEPTRVGPMPVAPPPPAAGSDDVTVRKAAGDLSRAAKSVPAPQSSAPLELDFGGPSLAASPPGPTLEAPADPFAANPAALLADVPALDSGELFGGLTGPHAQLTSTGPVDLSAPSGEPDRGFFDVPERPVPAPAPTDFGNPPETPESEEAPQPVALGRVTRPAGKPDDARGLDEVKSSGAARRVSGLVANISIAAALLVVLVTVGSVYLNEGKVELSAISVERVRELVFPTRQIVTRDVSNGLYETREGRAVFFVRGEVENRGEQPGRAKVRAEILDGSTLVRAVEGFAGAIPTPEQLHEVKSAEDVAALAAKLDAASVQVAPGERASFLLAFYEYPPDLSAYRLRVTVLPAEGAASAAR